MADGFPFHRPVIAHSASLSRWREKRETFARLSIALHDILDQVAKHMPDWQQLHAMLERVAFGHAV
jgi:hypothetical protein